jgi:hypothetical protein
MIPAQEAPGYYWRTNDAADLAFNEAGPQPPTHISCYNLHDTLNRGEIAQVLIAELHFLARAHFGIRNVGWTGDAYRFGIYSFTRQFGSLKLSSLFPMAAAWKHICFLTW